MQITQGLDGSSRSFPPAFFLYFCGAQICRMTMTNFMLLIHQLPQFIICIYPSVPRRESLKTLEVRLQVGQSSASKKAWEAFVHFTRSVELIKDVGVYHVEKCVPTPRLVCYCFLFLISQASQKTIQCHKSYQRRDLRLCAGCKAVYYCSEACQAESWKTVRRERCMRSRNCKLKRISV